MGCRLKSTKSKIRSFGTITKKRIVVVGGGASGPTTAAGGARDGAHVTIVEHIDRVGKKILSTGNGGCNLINLWAEADYYRCGRREFPMEVVRGSGVDGILAFFEDLGIEPKDRNGCIYPSSNQASIVLDVLRNEVERLGVAVLLSCRVGKIEPAVSDGHVCYKVHTGQGILDADAVILVAGSKVAPPTGSDGSGCELAGRLRHRVIKPLPALVQLRCQGNLYWQMADIRTKAGVKLMAAGELLARDRGELQLIDYDLSDIPIFQVDRFVARAPDQGKRVVTLVDFVPSWDDGKAFGLLKKRASLLGHRTVEELFTDLLNKKLALALIKLAGIKPSQKSGDLSPRQLKLLLGRIKSYETIVMLVNPFANAQVYCDGVDTGEVDTAAMKSRLRANLYLVGELLDANGTCGRYNLQSAQFGGTIAGTHVVGGHPVGKHEAGANKVVAHGAYVSAPSGKRNRK